ncbi:hypothetical protein AAVH_06712 [Aphelenchoides avenae]|nr:hypothetical protein AAVH_06712 [Aphelenchus avenae]
MDVSKDPAPTTNQGHEELKQHILQLAAELQVKEALLQDQARRNQVSANLIENMRTELRQQSNRLVVRCYQRSERNDPDAGHFGSNACSVKRTGLYTLVGVTTQCSEAHSRYADLCSCNNNPGHSGTVRASKQGGIGYISSTSAHRQQVHRRQQQHYLRRVFTPVRYQTLRRPRTHRLNDCQHLLKSRQA